MGSKQVLPLKVRVDLGVMAVNGYSTFPYVPEREPHYQMQSTVISRLPFFLEGVLPSAEMHLAYSATTGD